MISIPYVHVHHHACSEDATLEEVLIVLGILVCVIGAILLYGRWWTR